MAPKKKDEEPPPPEELLLKHGQGFTIGGEVYWVQFSKQLESGVELKPGSKGTLEALGELIKNEAEFEIDLVSIKFDDFEEPQTVPLSALSVNPPPLDMLDELSTGLRLPLRGVDVDKIWGLGEGAFEKQADLITQLLGLTQRYGTGRREIICDFHLYNLVHAKSLCLSSTQGAVFHAIMDELLQQMISETASTKTRPEEMFTSEQCFKHFQTRILAHARQDPPQRLGIFRDSEVRLLTDFAAVTLFKHYLLYQYCLNFDREIETLRFNPFLERPSAPPDLNLATMKKAERQKQAQEKQDLQMAEDLDEEEEEEHELSEEEKVHRIVQEKLKQTEEKLQARLNQREQEFMQRLEAQGKGKK